MSQFEALKFRLQDYPGKWAAVSITDPGDGIMFSQGFEGVFRLEFLDDAKDVPENRKIYELLQFIEKVLVSEQNLLIHCFMGVSRSYALAVFLDSFSKLKLKDYKKHNRPFSHALNAQFNPDKFPSISKGDFEVYAHPRETINELVTCPICMGHDLECRLCHGDGKVSKYWYM